MRKSFLLFFIVAGFIALNSQTAKAQFFKESSFYKVPTSKRLVFKRKYHDVNLTGRGLYQTDGLDSIPTYKLRARLQSLFGEPTVTIEDLIYKPNFRPGMAVEFEYRIIVDGKYPLWIMDSFGPFGEGLVYAGASKYIDLMPQIMRDFTEKMLNAEPAPFMDYYYATDREKWYKVQYKDGEYTIKHIKSPPNMSFHSQY